MKPSTQTFTALAIFDWIAAHGPSEKHDGLTDEQREHWLDFVSGLVDDNRRPPAYVTSNSDSEHFGRCEVTGAQGDCLTFTAVWH